MKLNYVLTEIKELSFKKNLQSTIQVTIGVKTDYKVLYAEDGETCFGEFEVEFISTEDPEQLRIIYRAKSLFKLSDGELTEETKKMIHIEIYNRLFPMHSATVKAFEAMVGLPDIAIPYQDIDVQKIKLI